MVSARLALPLFRLTLPATGEKAAGGGSQAEVGTFLQWADKGHACEVRASMSVCVSACDTTHSVGVCAGGAVVEVGVAADDDGKGHMK
jgi:hypothetical protein